MVKDINLEIYLKVFKSKIPITKGTIVTMENRYYIITGQTMSKKYKHTVYYCRMLQSDTTKIFNIEQLEVVTFSADVFEKGKCLGTYPIDFDSLEKIGYTTKVQTVRGHLSIFKRKAHIGDAILYPYNGIIKDIIKGEIQVYYDGVEGITLNRSHITLATNDIITVLKLVCPKCGS